MWLWGPVANVDAGIRQQGLNAAPCQLERAPERRKYELFDQVNPLQESDTVAYLGIHRILRIPTGTDWCWIVSIHSRPSIGISSMVDTCVAVLTLIKCFPTSSQHFGHSDQWIKLLCLFYTSRVINMGIATLSTTAGAC